MSKRIFSRVVVAGLLLCSGCASPLKSSDPATRIEAVSNISDEDALFFIAMNIEVGLKGKWPEMYNETHLRNGEYAEDVRVAAVNGISDPAKLLRCASWPDGEIYRAMDIEQGRFVYGGETYYVHDAESRLQQAVHPGNAVRAVALERLCRPESFEQVVNLLGSFQDMGCKGSESRTIRGTLFPDKERYSVGGKETSFVDHYARVKKDNPLDRVLKSVVERQSDQRLIRAFVALARKNGSAIYPTAILAAADKLDKSDQESLATTFRKMFCEASRNCEMPDELAMKIYRLLNENDADIVLAALRYSKPTDVFAIIDGIKDQKTYEGVFCYDKFYEFVSKSDQTSLYCPLDEIKTDVRLSTIKKLLAGVSDNVVLSQIAIKAPLFNVRYAAIERMDDDVHLSTVAMDAMKDCPYDTSAAKYDLISNRLEWWQRNEQQSAVKLRKLAISRIKDPSMLKRIRNEESSVEIKKSSSERLASLGHSDAQEIIAAEKYDASLFTMVNEMRNAKDLMCIAMSAKLKGVRIMAANSLPTTERVAICKKEMPDESAKAPEGRLTIGRFYLGMNIEDAFAVLCLHYPDIKPKFYQDNKVLCIADATGHDLAWANLASLEVHWITLPPTIVRRIVGFKSGTFADLERRVESLLGISFTPDLIAKGNVSQRIGNYENVDGETLRYFSSGIGYGEDFRRSVRKAINQHTIDYEPLNGGLGAVFANALEDAMQSDENARDARSPRFAPQGSLQLQWTENATKGERNSSGGSSGSGLDTLRRTSSELETLGFQLEGALNQINNLSL